MSGSTPSLAPVTIIRFRVDDSESFGYGTHMPTNNRPMTCTECGSDIIIIGTRGYSLLRHMVNAGEITVGEARAELSSPVLTDEERSFLAGWVLERSDQGDHWKAGDQETLTCGCIISYDREQIGSHCGTAACVLSRELSYAVADWPEA